MSVLTKQQRKALALIRRHPDASVFSTETSSDRYGAFIHWRTAEALERKGYIRINGRDAYADIVLIGDETK